MIDTVDSLVEDIALARANLNCACEEHMHWGCALVRENNLIRITRMEERLLVLLNKK